MKINDLLKRLKQDGWYVARQAGSHLIMKHPVKKETLSVPFHRGKEIPTGTLQSILKQAGLK